MDQQGKENQTSEVLNRDIPGCKPEASAESARTCVAKKWIEPFSPVPHRRLLFERRLPRRWRLRTAIKDQHVNVKALGPRLPDGGAKLRLRLEVRGCDVRYVS